MTLESSKSHVRVESPNSGNDEASGEQSRWMAQESGFIAAKNSKRYETKISHGESTGRESGLEWMLNVLQG